MAGSLSRRRFLALAGAGLAAACSRGGSKTQTRIEVPPTETPVPTPVPTPTPVPEPTTLRGWADRLGLILGVLPNGVVIDATPPNTAYRDLVAREFNLFGTGISWPTQRPSDPGDYAMKGEYFERALRLAFQNKQTCRCTGLFWANNLPGWLRPASVTRNDLIEIMRNRAKALMGYYNGRVQQWVVVNEAFHINGNIGSSGDLFAGIIGPDYVEIAFEMARDADSSALLIYNDYGNEVPGPQSDRNAQQISSLKSKGLVDAVGIQMHLEAARPPTKQALISNMQRFKSLGVEVLITECDVRLTNVQGTTEARFALQADVFRRVFEAALESGACNSITVQNPGDKYSWLEIPPIPAFGGPTAQATPWGDDLNPKPAYYAMLDVLKKAAQVR